MNEPENNEQHQSSTGSLFLKFVTVIVLLIVLVAGSSFLWIYSYSRTPGPNGPSEVVVIIPPGSSFRQITTILADAGLIHEDIRFALIARFLGLSGKVQAGEFLLTAGTTPVNVLQALIKAKPL